MIKFFRRIRQRLLAENKLSKYLLYAIGEILLVVIGILIALWINNKNQAYSNGKIARTYLEDFKRDLESDVNTLEEKILKNEVMIMRADSIFIVSSKKILSDKEKSRFNVWAGSLMTESYYVPEKTTIRQFESTNSSHLITLKSLKDQLFSYYTINDQIENNMEKSVQLYQHNFMTKDLMGAFKIDDQSSSSLNIIAQKLENDFELKMAIRFKRSITTNQNKKYRILKEKAENLIKLINTELE